MRNTFINNLQDLAEKNSKIMLLTGDLGFSVLEKFQKQFPDRFLNMGVAESNMVGAASGLALCGMKPYIYSIVPFVTMRCYEQIRNDICYQNVDVKIVGVGGGIVYGNLGPTHHSREDIAIMRALPNMTVVCPADPIETKLIVEESVKFNGPLYIRLGKGKDPVVHKKNPNIEIGKGVMINDGKDITIIATGNILSTAVASADMLSKKGLSVRLISMHTVKPLDKEMILNASNETKAIFTLEEHSIIGGLGSAVSEVLAENDSKILFRRIGLEDVFEKTVGSHEYLCKLNNLSPDAITNFVFKTYKGY
ncbi:MAG: 1-deoxy-D-xylulose-5-phosphate synthase [Nanoarchaeota archaeon]|nr:1-deoxy-D-xylulose-5-phosphate synthase [Nanoarchaeota archaeon]